MGDKKYAIREKGKRDSYLNNFRVDLGRIVFVNFISKKSDTVIEFSSKEDAQRTADRIAKQRKLTLEPVLLEM
jgi:hypothetical protein